MYEFTKQVKAKGWTNKAMAKRWGLTERQMTNIAAKPKQRDWDAINSLPSHKEA